jgi:hypothetical protein
MFDTCQQTYTIPIAKKTFTAAPKCIDFTPLIVKPPINRRIQYIRHKGPAVREKYGLNFLTLGRQISSVSYLDFPINSRYNRFGLQHPVFHIILLLKDMPVSFDRRNLY